jgi:hypothetical protein
MRVSILACALVAASCAVGPDDRGARTPMALLDAYLVAHGMAASVVEDPDADPAVKAQLEELDNKARDAVRRLTGSGEGFADEDATARAVSALTDYAARQTSVAR